MKRFTFTFSDTIWHKIYEPLLRHSRIFRNLIIVYSYIRRKIITKPIPKEILINKEGFKDYNINYNWFIENKPIGISWIARLKNSVDYLEQVVEAFLPYLDEIILASEKSTDWTNELCEKLAKKYPDKIKYYLYEHKINFRDYDWIEQPTSDSIHSFAYFTNWAFAKSKYKYVMRLDDDILPISETWEKMRNYIFEKKPKKYLLYFWINVLKRWNKIWVMSKQPRCWTWWDNWIYPVSKYTYFTQIVWSTEAFHLDLYYKAFEFWYLHLKNLKKLNWTADYKDSEWWKFFQSLSDKSDIHEFHKYVKFPTSRIYEILFDNNIIWIK